MRAGRTVCLSLVNVNHLRPYEVLLGTTGYLYYNITCDGTPLYLSLLFHLCRTSLRTNGT